MSLTLDLPIELENELEAEAAVRQLPLSEYVVRLLADGRKTKPSLQTGAALVAYWQQEGLIGTRPDITDASAHARTVRDQSQQRKQS